MLLGLKPARAAHIAQGFAPIGTCQRVRVIREASEFKFKAHFTLCEEANDESFLSPYAGQPRSLARACRNRLGYETGAGNN